MTPLPSPPLPPSWDEIFMSMYFEMSIITKHFPFLSFSYQWLKVYYSIDFVTKPLLQTAITIPQPETEYCLIFSLKYIIIGLL